MAQTTTMALGASVTLDPRIRLGFVLPVHPFLVSMGQPFAMVPGDAVLSAAVPLSEPEGSVQHTWTVALETRTGDATLFAGGFGSVFGGLAGQWAPTQRWTLGYAVGLRLRRAEDLGGGVWGNAAEFGLASAIHLSDRLELGLETFGSAGLREGTRLSRPLEVLVTTRLRQAPLQPLLGVGGGIGRGVGNPEYRLLAGLQVRGSLANDKDGDGYVDLRDLCPSRPEDRDHWRDFEGCPDPDNDHDGLVDKDDDCPNDPETVNAYLDEDGCPDQRATVTVLVTPDAAEQTVVTIGERPPFAIFAGVPYRVEVDPGVHLVRANASGYVAAFFAHDLPEGQSELVVKLVAVPRGRLQVKVVDAEGRSLAAHAWIGDAEGISLPDGTLTLPYQEGLVEIRAASDGFQEAVVEVHVPPEGTVDAVLVLPRLAVALASRRLVLSNEIAFALDEADLAAEADAMLDAMAQWLKDHPEVKLVRIEGHADAIGASAYNLALSRKRALTVLDALVKRGVAAERLEAIGSGESIRLEAAGRRLVEFLVLVWDDEALPDGANAPEAARAKLP